jgi:outer membrane protein assembly factor BamB
MPSAATLLRLVSLCALLSSAASARADNWERFRGPNGSGISSDKNIPIKFGTAENVRWKVKIEGMGHSSPIVWGDRVFLQTASLDASDRSLLCLDAKTGKEIWKRSIPGVRPDQPLRQDTSLASATPTTDGEAVYIPFWNGKDIIMTAYSFKGDKLWERNLGEFVSQHGAGASPILYKNLVIFSVDKDAFKELADKTKAKDPKTKKYPTIKLPVPNPSTLYALDKKTGKTVWEEPREAIRACYSMPFLLEKAGPTPELIVTSTSAITSYDPETGKSNWYWTWTFKKDPLRTIAASTYADGVLLACSGDGSGERLMVAVAINNKGKEARPEQIWSNAKEFPYMTCPLIKGDHVYFANDVGRAGCFVAKTGKKVWFETVPDAKFYASPIMIDGKIYAASERGDVFVFPADPKEYQQLARNSFGEIIRATPAVANGALYIRTEKHLYCIGK